MDGNRKLPASVNFGFVCRLLTNNAINFIDDGAFAKVPLIQL